VTEYHEIKDLYDSERKALQGIRFAMASKYMTKGATTELQEDDLKRKFTDEAINRCAEIGLVVDVLWYWTQLRCAVCSFKTGKDILFNEGESCPSCGSHEGDWHAGSPDCSDDPTDNNLYWNPRIVVVGRTEKMQEYDHDQQKHEVRSGLLDGKAGEIREDGSFREDAKKKNFFT